MGDDACSAVKSDLQEGDFTRHSNSIPIYILGKDKIKKGTKIVLKDPIREPVQTVDGTILYTKRGCTIDIVASSIEIRDDIYLDISDILIATDRGYKIKKGKDKFHTMKLNLNTFGVSMIL